MFKEHHRRCGDLSVRRRLADACKICRMIGIFGWGKYPRWRKKDSTNSTGSPLEQYSSTTSAFSTVSVCSEMLSATSCGSDEFDSSYSRRSREACL